MSKPVITFVFKVLQDGLLALHTCFTHVQTCDNVRAQSTTEWTASVHILYTCPRVQYVLYGMDCFGTYLTHVQTGDKLRVQVLYGLDCFGANLFHVQTCDKVRVQSATEWTASIHILHNVQTCDKVRVQSAMEWTASVDILHIYPNL